MIDNKTILITGGTGSVGQAITRLLLTKYNTKEIRIFSHTEYDQVNALNMLVVFAAKRINIDKLRMVIGDIKDASSIERAMQGVDIVIHLAAMKHVDLCEKNPIEAVKNNIIGSMNVLESALRLYPEVLIGMSTDKASTCCNLYAKTKAVMEDMFISSSTDSTKIACIRSGNILNSRGSVTEIFRSQVKNGLKVQITNPEMTRFWTTLNDISQYIIDKIEHINGGEIFIPKQGSSSIATLAKLFSDEYEIIGEREGEQMHETLISKNESEYSEIFESEYILTLKKRVNQFLNFEYRSDTNLWKLTKEGLIRMINIE